MKSNARFGGLFVVVLLIVMSCGKAIPKSKEQKPDTEGPEAKPIKPPLEGEAAWPTQEEIWASLKQDTPANRQNIITQLLKIDNLPTDQKKTFINSLWEREQREKIYPIQAIILGPVDDKVVKILSMILDALDAEKKKAFIEAKVDDNSQLKQLSNRDATGQVQKSPVRLTNNAGFDDLVSLGTLLTIYIKNGADLKIFDKQESMEALLAILFQAPNEEGFPALMKRVFEEPAYLGNRQEWTYWFFGWTLEDTIRAKALQSVIKSNEIKDLDKKFLQGHLFMTALAEDIRNIVMKQEPIGYKEGIFNLGAATGDYKASLTLFNRIFDNDYGLKPLALSTDFPLPIGKPGSAIMVALQLVNLSDLTLPESIKKIGGQTLRRKMAALVKTIAIKLKQLVQDKTQWKTLVEHRDADTNLNAIDYLEQEMKIEDVPIGKAQDLLGL
jgi:hypothetical protein